jgi:hypothetical protein
MSFEHLAKVIPISSATNWGRPPLPPSKGEEMGKVIEYPIFVTMAAARNDKLVSFDLYDPLEDPDLTEAAEAFWDDVRDDEYS